MRDNYGRQGIVLWENPPPDRDWLKIQKDARMRKVGASRWWAIAPLIGGGACAPEPLIERLRAASVADALRLARRHPMSYFMLVRVFPGLAQRMPPPDGK